jgi:DNA helicase-2/ATP-dependent DNA helicase PcrA
VKDADKFEMLPISDKEIQWACQQLAMKADAFSGPDGSDRRAGVLKSTERMDVAACPGSGKTTLLVAKLAILAAKWPHRTRGICVLSHTNVARREIESRLGHTAAGQRLLSYPHFVGTNPWFYQ